MKRLIRVAMLLCLVTILLTAVSLKLAEAKSSSLWCAKCQSSYIPNSGGTAFKSLNGVAVVSAKNIWAVGSSYAGSGTIVTLTEQWNGKRWRIVKSPNTGVEQSGGGQYSIFNGVTAVSASDVWAVGSTFNGSVEQTLIEQWNGKKWSIIPSPNPGSVYNTLFGVAAVTANDIWAVGESTSSSSAQTLIEHWDGSKWSVSPSPSSGVGLSGGAASLLLSVAVVSSSDVWAVGGFPGKTGQEQTLIEQWNGKKWSIIPSPNTGIGFSGGGQYAILSGVAAISASSVWAVGSSINGNTQQTLIEQWNGKKWSVVPSPNQGSGGSALNSVAVASSSDIWSAGSSINGNMQQTLIEQWNGKKWSVVPSPNPVGSIADFLVGIAVVTANNAWAVGNYTDSGNTGHTLIEHWNGKQWSIVSSPNDANEG